MLDMLLVTLALAGAITWIGLTWFRRARAAATAPPGSCGGCEGCGGCPREPVAITVRPPAPRPGRR